MIFIFKFSILAIREIKKREKKILAKTGENLVKSGKIKAGTGGGHIIFFKVYLRHCLIYEIMSE